MKKFGPFTVSLAKQTPPKTSVEIGTSRNGTLPSIFDDEFIDTDKIGATDYRKMLDNDGTIQALYSTIVMPLLGSNWTIEPDDDTPDAVNQSVWVEDALRKPPHKGGMSTPFELVIAQALRAVVEGYAGFEKVYELVDGKIVYKKIAWRDPSTITMRTDERGGFNGLRQRAFIGNQYSDVVIPLDRCWLYTYGKEFHSLKGRSAFTAAYVAYDKKRKLLYFAEQQAQADALLTKLVEGKERGSQAELDSTVGTVDEIGFKATVGVPNGYKVSVLDSTGRMDILPLIEFQNAEMARSVLAMFILLGNGSKTGSYSLSQDQSDFFIQALMAIRKSLEQHITSYLIPDLYKFNFATPQYGTFKFEDITDSTIELLKTVFVKLTEKDRLPDQVIKGIVQKMADKLDIDVDLLEQASSSEDIPEVVEPVAPKKDLSLSEYDGWRRTPTQAEMRINFDAMVKKFNTLEAECERTIRPIYDQLAADALVKLNRYIDENAYDKINVKNLFDENLKNQYVRVLKEAGLEAYVYGKNGASDELQVKAPATPKDSKDFFRDNAVSVVDNQLSDLIFRIQTEVSSARRKDQLSESSAIEVGAALAAIFPEYYKEIIGVTASAAISMGVNKGRKDVFDVYDDRIYAYQYSALLDNRTCPTCQALDGKVLSRKQYLETRFDPPIHLDCRCIWVAILKDELDPPAITGFPEKPGGLDEPRLSRILEEQAVELSKKAVHDEVQRILAEG